MREWSVASGLLEIGRELLLVANRRRNGSVDWTTPGGVVDPGETTEVALRREIAEETGLTVDTFGGRMWSVTVEFADLGNRLEVEVHRATEWSGELTIDDPDGIVTHVEFVDHPVARDRLRSAPMWVAEPLTEWLERPWAEPRPFAYRALGVDPYRLRCERLE